MHDTMTLPDKLVAAAEHPDNWDVRGLMMEAADALLEHCDDLYGEDGILRNDPEDDDDDDDGPECTDPLDVASVVLPNDRHPCQCNRHTTERREVVPGWTLEELLSREG